MRYAEMKRLYDNEGTRYGHLADVMEGIEAGDIGHGRRMDGRGGYADEISIRDCFRAYIPNGEEIYNAMMFRKSGRMQFAEIREAAGDAINTGDFANITGQFMYNMMLEGYNYPQAVWPQLCETYKTTLLNGERIPGVGEFGYGGVEIVGEGERFPLLAPNEEWIDTPALNKRGFIAELTREMLMQDQTGLVAMRAKDGGKWLSINKDIRVIMAATGYLNNYSRNGVASNTYLTSGAYINKTSVPLVNWQSVQTAELLQAAITDPNTGTPIIVDNPRLLVPNALKRSANFLLQASQVAMVDNTPTANTVRAYGANPMNTGMWGGGRPDVVSNSFVGNTIVTGGSSNNTTAWFGGDFVKAILYKEAFGVEVTQAAPNSSEQFYRDIMMGWKFVEMGVPALRNPRYIYQGNS